MFAKKANNSQSSDRKNTKMHVSQENNDYHKNFNVEVPQRLFI